jgi:hypothetical protein
MLRAVKQVFACCAQANFALFLALRERVEVPVWRDFLSVESDLHAVAGRAASGITYSGAPEEEMARLSAAITAVPAYGDTTWRRSITRTT